MTRPLAIPENQVRAIIRAAKKEGGVRIEVRIGSVVVAVLPDNDEKDDENNILDTEGDVRL